MAKRLIPLRAFEEACEDQLAIVRRAWPEGVPLTKAAALKAVRLGLDIDWAAERLLPAPARAEYEKVRAAAWAEYDKVTAPARAEYEKVRAAAWAEYLKVRAMTLLQLLREAAA